MTASPTPTPNEKLVLRFADADLMRRLDFGIRDHLDRARECMPSDASTACWRKHKQEFVFLPAAPMGEGYAISRVFFLLRKDAEPQLIAFTYSPMRSLLVDIRDFLLPNFDMGHNEPGAFLLTRDAIVLIHLDRCSKQSFGTIIPYPHLTGHELFELTSTLEAEFPGRFEIEMP